MGLNENVRRVANLVICYGAWTCTVGVAAWIVFHGVPATVRWPTFSVIIMMGVGITASLIRSRYKLADTIKDVFHAGIAVGRNQEREKLSGEPVRLPEEDC
jgi:hypothetical protein